MALSILTVTVDTTDPVPLAQWWADQLGAQVSDQTGSPSSTRSSWSNPTCAARHPSGAERVGASSSTAGG